MFWFTIDSSVFLNEGVQLFFHDICHFLFVMLIVNLSCWFPSRQDIVYWIAEGINYLKNHSDVIEITFAFVESKQRILTK